MPGFAKKEFDNTNRGALFKNKDKREGKKDADMRGTLNVDGQEYWVNGWINVSKAGEKWISFSVKSKEASKLQRLNDADDWVKDQQKLKAAEPEMDDEIPF